MIQMTAHVKAIVTLYHSFIVSVITFHNMIRLELFLYT